MLPFIFFIFQIQIFKYPKLSHYLFNVDNYEEIENDYNKNEKLGESHLRSFLLSRWRRWRRTNRRRRQKIEGVYFWDVIKSW